LLGSASGCYRPDIAPGGFVCGDGGVCPDGFHCLSADNRCWQGDAGPPPPVCSIPTPPSTCTTPPASGQPCNPACQFGCACGRCNVVKGAAQCNQTAGSKVVNDVCNVSADDCKPGLYCQPECNTPGFGRCYKFCSTGADCEDGICMALARNASFQPIPGFTVCDIAPQNPPCDPIKNTGCPPDFNDLLGCYYQVGSGPYCDCKGTNPAGTTCALNNDCTPGEICLQTGPKPPAQCEELCSLSQNTCSAGDLCTPADSTYGFCTAN
jgi:hypothetical protein